MGFMSELRKLTQPYDDEDDFFEGSDTSSYRPADNISSADETFESSFRAPEKAEPAPKKKFLRKPAVFSALEAQDEEPIDDAFDEEAFNEAPTGGLFGNLGAKRNARAPRAPRGKNEMPVDSRVIMFKPQSFDEARELVTYLQQHRTVVMALDGVPTDMARRLLDLCSGIALALDGKITPVSAKTFFVTPRNVDIVGSLGQDAGFFG